MATALWHCWVTTTTVGYGDVTLETTAARAWASVHILFSVSWLSAVIRRVRAARKQRRLALQRAAIIQARYPACPQPVSGAQNQT